MRYVVLWGVFLMCVAVIAFAQQPAVPLPTHDQLELRLADNAMAAQRALCATLWQQGNELEQQLKKLQEEHTTLMKESAEVLKQVNSLTLQGFQDFTAIRPYPYLCLNTDGRIAWQKDECH